MDGTFRFPAVRGIQAGREYYVIMCPLKVVSRLFDFDSETIPADMRAQRVLNRARVPEIARYIVNNPSDYVLSSVTASVDGEIKFEPLAPTGEHRSVGFVSIDMTSRILINDGQHRRAAIAEALKQKPELGDETISVVLFIDAGLARSQQWFADLNKYAVRPTRSIGILYDHRDVLSKLARELERRVPIFRGITELEKTTISNRSSCCFTLSAIYQASQALLGKSRKDQVTRSDVQLACDYWTTLGSTISEWNAVIEHRMNPSELRQEYVHGHGVTLQALGFVGHAVIAKWPKNWQEKLQPVAEIDWRRTNSLWVGRALVHGKMSKTRDSVLLTSNAIKQMLQISLDAEEQRLEDSYHSQVRSEV